MWDKGEAAEGGFLGRLVGWNDHSCSTTVTNGNRVVKLSWLLRKDPHGCVSSAPRSGLSWCHRNHVSEGAVNMPPSRTAFYAMNVRQTCTGENCGLRTQAGFMASGF
jgi:hypothetical protein